MDGTQAIIDRLRDMISLMRRDNHWNEAPAEVEEIVAGGTTTTYVGYPAKTESATTDAEWCIMKVVVTVAGGTTTTTRKFANGDQLKDKVWSNRATLTYSYLAYGY